MLNIKKIKPMANYLITTKETYTEEEAKKDGLILKAVGAVKEFQKVVAVGPMVRTINVGDLVAINPTRYAKKKYEEGSLKDGIIKENPVVLYIFKEVELDHIPHLILTEQDIDYILEEYTEEEIQKEGKQELILPKKDLIV